jgi:hypothetical protein
MNEWPVAPAFDQPGFGESFQMVRNGGGCHALQRRYLAAIHALLSSDSFENHQARLIG